VKSFPIINEGLVIYYHINKFNIKLKTENFKIMQYYNSTNGLNKNYETMLITHISYLLKNERYILD